MKRKMQLAAGVLAGTVLFALSAAAEGNLTVTDKTAFIYPGKDSGCFFAKVENTGDAPVGVDSGKLVLFSDSEDILVTSDYITAYPTRLVLEPGEYTYLSEFLWNSTLENQTIGDVKFSIGPAENGKEAETIPCEVSCTINGPDSYDNYINITVKNEDSQVRYGYYLVAALYDTEGNLIYVDKNRYEKIGLHPGSSMTVGLYIDTDNMEYFEANGIGIGSADAIVYYIPEE